MSIVSWRGSTTGWRTALGKASPGPQPREASFLEVEPAALQFSTLKAAEDEEGAYILRLYNPTSLPVKGLVRFRRPPQEAALANLDEERGKSIRLSPDGAIPVLAGPKKIVTLYLAWKG